MGMENVVPALNSLINYFQNNKYVFNYWIGAFIEQKMVMRVSVSIHISLIETHYSYEGA
jgi:hypothetical protein